ncbi:MAG TPA: cytochrome c oxidase subunit II [Gaiellaceae bacterium]|nr:cytochrome c oxidase subunit II [Gaiellaceae bacterium]
MRAKLFLIGGLLLAAALTAPVALADNGGFTPVAPESPNAEGIRDSYLFVSIFVFSIFVLVEGLLIAFIVRYRRRKRARFEDGAPIHGATKLELLWSAFPVVILFLIGAFVFIELPGIKDVPSAATGDQLEIRVTGRQYYWQYEYPNGVIAIDTMAAPAGVPVRLEVTSPDDDVIHSWWIPALGGKIDAIPGTVNETWFQADTPGTYTGQCAELCGLEHARMLASVEVLPEAEFAAWLERRRAEQTAGSGELGKEEWEGACAKCHGLSGEGGIGPKLAGSIVLADPEAVENLVRNGRRTMPAVGSGWTSEQVEALTAYLKENPPSGS